MEHNVDIYDKKMPENIVEKDQFHFLIFMEPPQILIVLMFEFFSSFVIKTEVSYCGIGKSCD